MKKVRDLVLYRDERFFSSFPSIIAYPEKDEILLFFRRARDMRWLIHTPVVNDKLKELTERVDHIDPRSEIAMIRFDGNFNIKDPARGLPVNVEAGDQDPSVLALDDGRIVLASFSWFPVSAEFEDYLNETGIGFAGCIYLSGCLFISWGAYTRISTDYGHSWTDHQYLPPLPNAKDIIPGKKPNAGGGTRGNMVIAKDEILLAIYPGSLAHLYASQDGGNTWQYRSLIAQDDEALFHEPSLHYTPNGKLIAFLRTSKLDDHLVTVESYDNGHTWQPWQKRDVIGHPYHPLRLPDNQVLLTYGYRHEPYGIRARILSPECDNIDSSEEIIIRDDGLCGDIGYTWATNLNDNKVAVVYYFCRPDDTVRHIACSILTTD